jgi:hypothetical protein
MDNNFEFSSGNAKTVIPPATESDKYFWSANFRMGLQDNAVNHGKTTSKVSHKKHKKTKSFA